MQVGPINVQAGVHIPSVGSLRLDRRLVDGSPTRILKNIEQSNGWALDARVGATVNLFQEMDISANAQIPLWRGLNVLSA